MEKTDKMERPQRIWSHRGPDRLEVKGAVHASARHLTQVKDSAENDRAAAP
jgi:hypothetical protein